MSVTDGQDCRIALYPALQQRRSISLLVVIVRVRRRRRGVCRCLRVNDDHSHQRNVALTSLDRQVSSTSSNRHHQQQQQQQRHHRVTVNGHDYEHVWRHSVPSQHDNTTWYAVLSETNIVVTSYQKLTYHYSSPFVCPSPCEQHSYSKSCGRF